MQVEKNKSQLKVALPQESWDLKTGGLEIPETCEKHIQTPLFRRAPRDS